MKFQTLNEKAEARKAKAQRNKELRELQLQSRLLTLKTSNGPSYGSSDEEDSPTYRSSALKNIIEEVNEEEQKVQ